MRKNDEIDNLISVIEDFWQKKQNGECFNKNEAISIANNVIDLLDRGEISVVEKDVNGSWKINQWIKKAILLSFQGQNKEIKSFDGAIWFDKCENKFKSWKENDFQNANIRAVSGCFVRKGAFFSKGCVIMPSFVNIGAYVGANTMIDSMATIGSCCYVGNICHISANVCIGGVLEPLQANPVIIEDNCFIGSGSQITEGVIVGEGSVVASGVFVSASVKIIDRETGEVFLGKIPPYSVVVGGSYQTKNNLSINCAIITKKITPEVRNKTSINDLLR